MKVRARGGTEVHCWGNGNEMHEQITKIVAVLKMVCFC
jgi:hypothetical protein